MHDKHMVLCTDARHMSSDMQILRSYVAMAPCHEIAAFVMRAGLRPASATQPPQKEGSSESI